MDIKMSDLLRAQAEEVSLFHEAAEYALTYMDEVTERSVYPEEKHLESLSIFKEKMPESPVDPHEILAQLHRYGSPATVAQTGGRYFGFVDGGAVPVALAAKWLSDVWDQNAAVHAMSPITSVLETVCEEWIQKLLKLPVGTAAGFVGGSSQATLCALAAGRNHLLQKLGYDVGAKGLFGAPEIKVVLSEGAHSTIYKALSILGLGSERIIQVPMDEQGRIKADLVPTLDDKTLLILQAGNVNTGAFDPFESLCQQANQVGAWVHVDGAFGLWAAACDSMTHLTKGLDLADSWSVDAHKTLNAPYDNGIVLCRHRQALTGALQMSGSYIVASDNRDGMHYSLDMSRRARIVELWATLKALGRVGVAELVEDLHLKAVKFAELLSENGFEIHNAVCFNQVLASCENQEITQKTLKGIQSSGDMWCGGSLWDGAPVIRISVCSYRTNDEDIIRSVKAMINARELARQNSVGLMRRALDES